MLAELASVKDELESNNIQIAIIHMSDETTADSVFNAAGLEDVIQVSDPRKLIYQHFQMPRGKFKQLFGAQVWKRGFESYKAGFRVSMLDGDGFQLHGVALVHKGETVDKVIPEDASEKIDFLKFVNRSLAAT